MALLEFILEYVNPAAQTSRVFHEYKRLQRVYALRLHHLGGPEGVVSPGLYLEIEVSDGVQSLCQIDFRSHARRELIFAFPPFE